MFFSKSKYCGLWQCPKIAWLKKFKPDEYVFDDALKGRMENGNVVGDLAMNLFGDFTEVTSHKEDGSLDIRSMIQKTKNCISNGTENICEASFEYNGLYCAVDILRKEKNGYAIYEVKSSTHEDNYVYIVDVSYQKYVLEHCGVKITKTYVVNINSDYVFDGTLKLNELFKITDITDFVIQEQTNVKEQIKLAEEMLKQETEPAIDISANCHTPYKCGFWKYCSKHLPSPSVFDLYRTNFSKKLEWYNRGILSFKDLEATGWYLGNIQDMQIKFQNHNFEPHIDKDGIKEFLDKLKYPLYFLDFETMQPVIPEYVGTRPYQQIPFQYSLHIIEYEGGPLIHKEFLAESGEDPRRAIAESLCNDIPVGSCVLAYNMGFEKGRIHELANTFPDLYTKLRGITLHMEDLIEPFRTGCYYRKEIDGSLSIKSVLPAMFPNDPELDYHNLEGVHNGGEAMALFPKIKDLPKKEQKQARQNLLKYCELDTLAMVKIWQKLTELSK